MANRLALVVLQAKLFKFFEGIFSTWTYYSDYYQHQRRWGKILNKQAAMWPAVTIRLVYESQHKEKSKHLRDK